MYTHTDLYSVLHLFFFPLDEIEKLLFYFLTHILWYFQLYTFFYVLKKKFFSGHYLSFAYKFFSVNISVTQLCRLFVTP